MTDPYGNNVRDILRRGPPTSPSAITRTGKTLRDKHRGSLKMGADGREYIHTNLGWGPVTFLDEVGKPTSPPAGFYK